MKLLVPYVGELQGVDARLIRLAEFLGISCTTLSLAKPMGQCAEYLEGAISDRESCFVVNPRVMQDWIGGEKLPSEFASFLVARFPHLLVHAPRPEPFDCSVIDALSRGRLHAMVGIECAGQSYEISPDSKDVCGAFAGLSVGPANPANDRVFSTGPDASAVRQLISIDGRPLMATLRREKSEIWFLAGAEIADLNTEVGDTFLTEYFSRLLPHAMALRCIFGEESWRPCGQYASVIIDDPLLRRDYGFLNFEFLLGLMRQHNFHTTIAFIPHNFRRSSPRIAKMFRENTGRFALCFHGNDHTSGEFATTDITLLNTMLRIAENRMSVHHKIAGVPCDRVMVFPQGRFSAEAMTVLKSRNFDCAVNTDPCPAQSAVRLTLGELAQPAVLRYGGFPLFLRKDSLHTQSADIAFNLFFGRPVLIVEHHGIFRHPEFLTEVATRINTVAPNIHWTNLGRAVSNSILSRRTANGLYNILAYSRTVRVSNDNSESTNRFLIEWKHLGQKGSVDRVLQDETPFENFTADDAGVRLSVDLAPGSSETFSVLRRNPHVDLGKLGLRRKASAFVRRRLSEVRDNYLSKIPHVLEVANTLSARSFHTEGQ